MNRCLSFLILVSAGAGLAPFSMGDDRPTISVENIPVLEEKKLIINGLTLSPDRKKVALATARGKIWVLENPLETSVRYSDFRWSLFGEGLRKPGPLKWKSADILVREETGFTRLVDRDGDGRADEYLVAEPFPEWEEPGPFKGVAWNDQPISQGVFKGQHLGFGRGETHLSRLSICHDSRGRHYGMFVFLDNLKYPTDALLSLAPDTWMLAQSNRHDPQRNRTRFALARVRLNEATGPFEIQSIAATESGFEIRFTEPLLAESAVATWAYAVECLSDRIQVPIREAILGSDQKTVYLATEGPPEPEKFYHITCNGAWSAEREPVGHPTALFYFDSPADSKKGPRPAVPQEIESPVSFDEKLR